MAHAGGMYSKSSGVVDMDAKQFKEKVLKDKDGIWLVEFYAPWCGHCKALRPEYIKAAKALKGIGNVGAVDADAEKGIASQFQVQGFPTIKIFGADKTNPKPYQGQRNARGLVDGLLAEYRSIANGRLGGSGGSQGARRSSGGGAGGDSFGYQSSASVVLTDSNFDELVLSSKQPFLVEFYAPWCGHCKALAPEWVRAANELDGKFALGAVDATQHQHLAQRYGVRGYPTIKYFPPGSKDQPPEDYQGGRTASDITAWAMAKMEAAGWEPEINELNDEAAFKSACDKAGKICVLTFLPDIRDTGKEGREAIIQKVKNVAKRSQGPFVFNWVSANSQSEFESVFEMQAGFPAIALMNYGKKRYSVFTGAFEEKKLLKWVNAKGGTRAGRRGKIEGKWPSFATTEPWDGSEPEVYEEEFSLEELMAEDD